MVQDNSLCLKSTFCFISNIWLFQTIRFISKYMAQLKTVCFTSRVWWFTTVRFIPFPTHVTSVQGLCKSSSLVPRISISNIYHPWHPGPLHIIMLGTQNLYIFFLIPGIQLEVVMPNWGRQWLWFAFVYWDPSFGTHHPSGGKQWVRLAFLWYDPSCWPHRPKFKT